MNNEIPMTITNAADHYYSAVHVVHRDEKDRRSTPATLILSFIDTCFSMLILDIDTKIIVVLSSFFCVASMNE